MLINVIRIRINLKKKNFLKKSKIFFLFMKLNFSN